jgi:hypothetical protein
MDISGKEDVSKINTERNAVQCATFMLWNYKVINSYCTGIGDVYPLPCGYEPDLTSGLTV